LSDNMILTPNDLADKLNISRYCAMKLCRDKKINAFKVGKFWRIPLTSFFEYITSTLEDK